MSQILEPAKRFFDACETGKGWAGCKEYCLPDATFSSQARVITEIDKLKDYCEWVKGFFIPVPDGRYELHFFAADEERKTVAGYGVFHGTQTGPGGPAPAPTGKSVATDYVYTMMFEGNRIQHVTKIWNDTIALQQLGWN